MFTSLRLRQDCVTTTCRHPPPTTKPRSRHHRSKKKFPPTLPVASAAAREVQQTPLTQRVRRRLPRASPNRRTRIPESIIPPAVYHLPNQPRPTAEQGAGRAPEQGDEPHRGPARTCYPPTPAPPFVYAYARPGMLLRAGAGMKLPRREDPTCVRRGAGPGTWTPNMPQIPGDPTP
ncbi:hypothetical protein F4781DRAFT_431120 [Annulohypoxylon bovei var. microspora]|nr:hypothetical protein F4781DRAFT_431120 [Annulohypoxylon bovei var. microspora]